MIRLNARVLGGATLVGSLAIAGALLLSAPAEAAGGCYSGGALNSVGKCLDGQRCNRFYDGASDSYYYMWVDDSSCDSSKGGIKR
jgi:hypothetical protein